MVVDDFTGGAESPGSILILWELSVAKSNIEPFKKTAGGTCTSEAFLLHCLRQLPILFLELVLL